jgi:phosphotransferase system enzyme I (PtsP)
MRVFERGNARLDGFLDLIADASKSRSLDETLAVLVRKIAEMVGVSVCSVYLRDDATDELVMRANVGLGGAVGVRLAPREGITGFAVECLRPVAVAVATRDPRNKPVPGIGEERFPVFLAVPLLGDGRAAGALVVQRAERAFSPAEVTLVAALAAPVVHAVSLGRTRAHAAAEEHPGPVRLVGEPAAPGLVIGGVFFLPGLANPAGKASVPQRREGRARDAHVVREAFERTRASLAPLAAPYPSARMMLDDRRLLERALEWVETGVGVTRALDRVAREAARLAEWSGDALLRGRAVDVEGLCDRAAARLGGHASPVWAPGTVLVTHRLSTWDALELAAGGGIGVALAAPPADSPGLDIARARGLAATAGLAALFRWARSGARMFVDGDAGVVVVHPGRAEMADYRARRRA